VSYCRPNFPQSFNSLFSNFWRLSAAFPYASVSMLNMKTLSSLTLVFSDVTIAFALTVFLIAWAPELHLALGTRGFLLLFILTASFVALVTVVSLSFANRMPRPPG
jgi:ABC-type uncharacterized transport system fused permease/ATPase subunit